MEEKIEEKEDNYGRQGQGREGRGERIVQREISPSLSLPTRYTARIGRYVEDLNYIAVLPTIM